MSIDSTIRPGRIDVHHHVIPPVYLEAMSTAGVLSPIGIVDYPTWELATDLDMMNRNGIGTAMLSVTAPGVGFADPALARRTARQVNEYLAGLIGEHATRFGAFALLPLPDLDATLAEIDYATGTLGLDGVGLFTHYRGSYLGDPAFDTLFDKLAHERIVTFVHPTIPPATDQPTFGLPPSLYEFTFDTTRAVTNLLYSGTLDRHPDLELVISHAGGTLPYLAQRLTYAATITAALAPRQPVDLLGSLRRLHYDTAMSANPHTLAGLTSLVDVSQILFGTDYPFMPESTTVETIAGVTDFFSEPVREAVEFDNAIALFPALAARYAAAGHPGTHAPALPTVPAQRPGQ